MRAPVSTSCDECGRPSTHTPSRIAQPDRRPSGYRQYPPQVVRRVRFIRHAKDLGFTLEEIQELLELRVDPDSTCADVRKRARDKVADIEERIASLERMKAALDRLARKCRGRGPTTECPILTLDDLLEWMAEQLGELTRLISREQERERATRPGRP